MIFTMANMDKENDAVANNNENNSDRSLVRFEFMEVVVRIAMKRQEATIAGKAKETQKAALHAKMLTSGHPTKGMSDIATKLLFHKPKVDPINQDSIVLSDTSIGEDENRNMCEGNTDGMIEPAENIRSSISNPKENYITFNGTTLPTTITYVDTAARNHTERIKDHLDLQNTFTIWRFLPAHEGLVRRASLSPLSGSLSHQHLKKTITVTQKMESDSEKTGMRNADSPPGVLESMKKNPNDKSQRVSFHERHETKGEQNENKKKAAEDLEDLKFCWRSEFGALDQDGSGSIGSAELTMFMQKRVPGHTHEATCSMLHVIDTDGDGNISFDEFAQFMINVTAASAPAPALAPTPAITNSVKEKHPETIETDLKLNDGSVLVLSTRRSHVQRKKVAVQVHNDKLKALALRGLEKAHQDLRPTPPVGKPMDAAESVLFHLGKAFKIKKIERRNGVFQANSNTEGKQRRAATLIQSLQRKSLAIAIAAKLKADATTTVARYLEYVLKNYILAHSDGVDPMVPIFPSPSSSLSSLIFLLPPSSPSFSPLDEHTHIPPSLYGLLFEFHLRLNTSSSLHLVFLQVFREKYLLGNIEMDLVC